MREDVLETLQKWVIMRSMSTSIGYALVVSTFPCFQLSYRILKWEARIKYGVTLDPALLKTMETELKYQRVYQGSLKYALSDSGLESELVIPFVPNYDPEGNP
ncbi:hypothetical protein TNCV_1132771 [Trichonephila clavipes]|nr:hypothetical protein TNCV_1132771 [Trichonephila clavipes]